MSVKALAGVLLLLCAGWSFIFGPHLLNEWWALTNADGYREAELLVAEPTCINSRSSGGSTDRWCYLAGTIDGEHAELSTGSSLPPEYPAGSRVRVLYNPDMPLTGMNHESLRVVRWEPDIRAGARRRILQMAGVIAESLVLAVAIFAAFRWGLARRSRAPEGSYAADIGGGVPPLGVLIAALGLTLLLGQLTGGVALAGLALGALMTSGGFWLLQRHYVAADRRNGRLIVGEHVFGHPFQSRVLTVGSGTELVIRGTASPWTLALSGPNAAHVASLRSLGHAKRTAAGLAGVLGLVVRDEATRDAAPAAAPAPRAPRRARLVFVLGVLSLAGIPWIGWQQPAVRERVAVAVIRPIGMIEVRQLTFAGVWAARELAALQTETSLLSLARLINTLDPQHDPEVAAAAIAAIDAASGLGPPTGEWHDRVALRNQWIAGRVGRQLDAHGGVLSWFDVEPRFQREIAAMGGDDPHEAWLAWSMFGAGDLITPEQFLFAVGGALGDSRAIPFPIRRTSAPGEPLRVEGQPQPDRSNPVFVRTVGEALALRYLDYAGIDADPPEDDFGAWWAEFSRSRLLPPVVAHQGAR